MSTAYEPYDVLKIQFEALRQEVIEKIKASHQLGYYKLLALGAVLSVANAVDKAQSLKFGVYLGVTILPIAFDALLYFNGKGIVKVGTYIKLHIEPQLKRLAGHELDDLVLWEQYISLAGDGFGGRKWWNRYEAVQPAVSITVQVFGIFAFREAWPWLLIVGIAAVSLETWILVLALRRV